MKKLNHLKLIIYSFLLVSFSSCNEDDDSNPSSNTFDQISDIATFHGNLEGDIAVVYVQGGPSTELIEDEVLDQFISNTQTESALFVAVHQAQTKNPANFTNSDITFEEAKQFDLESVANLEKVVDFLKIQQGKTVYVTGCSFGAFVVQELIAAHGVDVADGYLIMSGRLNIDADTWQPFSEGKFTEYVYDNDGNYTINLLEVGINAEVRNLARLAAGLAFNRYTERLNSISSLSKITYVYGNRDDQVGTLSAQEIQFLNEKGANVVISEGGSHDDATIKGLTLLKQTFGIQ